MLSIKILKKIEDELYSAVICDVLDAMGYKNQCPRIPFHAYSNINKLVGRCKTTLWTDMFHDDPSPYILELEAVDNCNPGDVLIAAAGGSLRSGIWGELLSTAALNSGCKGVIVHGAVRDISKMREMQFPVFACGASSYDSQNRQRVVDLDVPVEIDGVTFASGDLVFCDEDGVVVVPAAVEDLVIEKAFEKVNAENLTRDSIRNGMKAKEAYIKYGVL